VSVDTDEAVIDDLYNLGFKLGIKPFDIKNAVEAADDKRELLRGWKRQYKKHERSILASDERRWLNQNAVESNERHADLQRDHAASRRAARERMTLGQRLDALRAEAVLEPGPGVAALGSTKIKGGESDGAPPDPALFRTTLDMRMEAHWIWFLRHIELIENDWDEFLGRGASRSWITASTEEKNRELLSKYVGVHSREVEKIAPWFGSARTISRIRSEAKLKPTTGEPK
jgi:hypothetical protein